MYLIPALPQQLRIKSPAPHPTVLRTARAATYSSMSLIAAALKPRSILIATDFSEASEKALRYSLALARFYESKFCLAHVVSSLGPAMVGPDAIAACEDAASREAADLENLLIQTGSLTGIRHKFIVRMGELWPELREIIRQEQRRPPRRRHTRTTRHSQVVFRLHCRADFPSGILSSLDLWATHRWPPLVWNALQAAHIPVCDRLRTRISPRLAASHCGCQSVRSQARFSQYRSSRTVSTLTKGSEEPPSGCAHENPPALDRTRRQCRTRPET